MKAPWKIPPFLLVFIYFLEAGVNLFVLDVNLVGAWGVDEAVVGQALDVVVKLSDCSLSI